MVGNALRVVIEQTVVALWAMLWTLSFALSEMKPQETTEKERDVCLAQGFTVRTGGGGKQGVSRRVDGTGALEQGGDCFGIDL